VRYRTPFGDALDGLIATVASTRDATATSRADALIDEYLRTPFVWPLDEAVHDLMLQLAALHTHGEATRVGIEATAYLLGTGWTPLGCAHASRCTVSDASALTHYVTLGDRDASTGRLDQALDVRASRHATLTRRHRRRP